MARIKNKKPSLQNNPKTGKNKVHKKRKNNEKKFKEIASKVNLTKNVDEKKLKNKNVAQNGVSVINKPKFDESWRLLFHNPKYTDSSSSGSSAEKSKPGNMKKKNYVNITKEKIEIPKENNDKNFKTQNHRTDQTKKNLNEKKFVLPPEMFVDKNLRRQRKRKPQMKWIVEDINNDDIDLSYEEVKKSKYDSSSDSDDEEYIDKYFLNKTDDESDDKEVASDQENSESETNEITITDDHDEFSRQLDEILNSGDGVLIKESDTDSDDNNEYAESLDNTTIDETGEDDDDDDDDDDDSSDILDLCDSDDETTTYDSMEETEDESCDFNEIYNIDSYDSDDDVDYIPPKDEDLYIPRGTAVIYDITDNNIEFDDEAQFIDITNNEKKTEPSDENICPELVPIEPIPSQSTKETTNCPIDLDIIEENETNEISLLDHVLCATTENVLSQSPTNATLKEKEFNKTSTCIFYTSTISNRHVLLHLKGITYFNGSFSATLISGLAECCGYTFENKNSVNCFSSTAQSLLYLKPIENENSPENLKQQINSISAYIQKSQIEEILSSFDYKLDALLILERLELSRLIILSNFMSENFFPNRNIILNQNNKNGHHLLAECILETNFYSDDQTGNIRGQELRKFKIPDNWKNIEMDEKSRTIVVGGISVGKSTCIRYLINKNINKFKKILLIDFDIGQPEIFLPQTISASIITTPLIGSGCFHSIKPKKSILFGDISVQWSIIKYIKCVLNLIKYCNENEEFQDIPWIVNTMGYNKGLGMEIIVGILKSFNITEIIQIQSPRSADNFNEIFTKEFVKTFEFNIYTNEFAGVNNIESDFKTTVLTAYENIYDQKNKFPANTLRYLRIILNLGDIFVEHDCDSLSEASNFKEILISDITIIVSYHEDNQNPTKETLLEAIDQNLVYLCKINESESKDETATECLGLGIVKKIDKINNKLYLLTNISHKFLNDVNSIALTGITIPKSFIENLNWKNKNEISFLENSDNSDGTRQVVHQSYRPDKTAENRLNFVKKI